ncbi:MAG: hypothetical protein HRT64_11110, partial [Erythrobacter sp.]|nr:hypothetical protein [Erythrobacter sp.]
GKLLTDMTVEFADNGGASNASLSGNFYLTSYQESGAFDGEVTYSLTLQSSGAWTYTAAA